MQDIIIATAILHNIAIRWKAEEFEEDEGEQRGGDDGYWGNGPLHIIPEDWYYPHLEEVERMVAEEQEAEEHLAPGGNARLGDAARRRLGGQLRDLLRQNMPP